MVKIAVFDSGLGSLSIIRPIQKTLKAEIIYFADQKNYPYGKKSKKQLKKIIERSIKTLEELFNPEIIVIGSNTPSLLFSNIIKKKIIGVFPPIKEAAKISKTKRIGILATQTAVNSKELSEFILKKNLSSKIKIFTINASELVELVESGKFYSNKNYCRKIVKKILKDKIKENNIDVITLSSTHLPFLLEILKKEFTDVTFLDPGETVAKKIAQITTKSQQNKIKIYSSGDVKLFEKQLKKIGIKNKVNSLS